MDAQALVSHPTGVLGVKLGSSARAVDALNQLASLQPLLYPLNTISPSTGIPTQNPRHGDVDIRITDRVEDMGHTCVTSSLLLSGNRETRPLRAPT